MKKHCDIHICIYASFLVILAGLSPVVAQATPTLNETEKFSIVWITDTQYLSESNAIYNDQLCRWIVENKNVYNVKMVVHTGDLVNDEGNRTQWLNANQSMGILLDNGIPYCWNVGNHDYNRSYWIGNQYTAFNPESLAAKPYWVSTKDDGMNNAAIFDILGWECLIVCIADYANESALDWARGVLDANPQAHAIVATHAYLNKQCKYDEWATNLKNTVLDKHANVFLTLNGHYHPTSGNRTRVGDRHELLFNQQDAYNRYGAACARILMVNVAEGTIDAQTFSVYLNKFLDDSNNDFILDTSFYNDLLVNRGFSLVSEFALVVMFIVVFLVVCVFLVRTHLDVRHR